MLYFCATPRGDGVQALTISAKPRLELGSVSAVDSARRTIFAVDAHCDGQRFIVRADEKLTAFIELERATCDDCD
jgi:hypothetical protein